MKHDLIVNFTHKSLTETFFFQIKLNMGFFIRHEKIFTRQSSITCCYGRINKRFISGVDMNTTNKGVGILVAGTCINLSIGFLYAWSVFKKAMALSVADGGWGWTHSQGNAAYTVAIVIWAVALLIGGVIQDRIGPKRVIQIGVFLVALGLIASSFFKSPLVLMFTIGVVVATGIGFVYGCITPMAMKWFHPSKKGLVSGITVGGFGIAAVFLAPLASTLIHHFGISNTFLFFGLGILMIAQPLSFFVDNPPKGYIPPTPSLKPGKNPLADQKPLQFTWKQMIKTREFYILWVMFVLSSSAGVMMIGHVASIATQQAGILNSAYIVSILAISNAFGRVGGGFLSDRIERLNTMLLIFKT